MRDLDAGAHWALAGRRGELAAGNGAAMRVAPLALFIDVDAPHARQTVGYALPPQWQAKIPCVSAIEELCVSASAD